MFEVGSKINPELRPFLERILFFNAGQERVIRGIETGILRFGKPRIVEGNGCLRICVEGSPGSQGLFCVCHQRGSEELAGVMLFHRGEPETLTLVHVAIADRFQHDLNLGYSPMFFLFQELQVIARRIRGVRRIELLYANQKSRYIKV